MQQTTRRRLKAALLATIIGAAILASPGAARADFEDESLSLDAPSAFDVSDAGLQVATAGMQSCGNGMYSNGGCKYFQASIVSECSILTQSGRCYQRFFKAGKLRGGTADYRSPSNTGACAQGGNATIGGSDFYTWRLLDMNVWEQRPSGSVLRYKFGPGQVRYNCDVEYGPITLRPQPFHVNYTTYVTFNFQHTCRSGSNCGTQYSSITFVMGVDR